LKSGRAVAGKLSRFREKHFKNSRKFAPGRDMKPVHLNDSSTRLTNVLKVSLRNRPSFPATALGVKRLEDCKLKDRIARRTPRDSVQGLRR